MWNGYIPIYTGCISSLWISPPPLPLDTLHRTEPRYVAASRFSPRHFSRYPLRIYIYTLSLSLSTLHFPCLLSVFEMKTFISSSSSRVYSSNLFFVSKEEIEIYYRWSADLRIRWKNTFFQEEGKDWLFFFFGKNTRHVRNEIGPVRSENPVLNRSDVSRVETAD